jgi:hypothetical protein
MLSPSEYRARGEAFRGRFGGLRLSLASTSGRRIARRRGRSTGQLLQRRAARSSLAQGRRPTGPSQASRRRPCEPDRPSNWEVLPSVTRFFATPRPPPCGRYSHTHDLMPDGRPNSENEVPHVRIEYTDKRVGRATFMRPDAFGSASRTGRLGKSPSLE